jgi:cbb3-type cytochrome oxidase subunit 1
VYTLVRRFIKTGIGFLFVGLAIGLYMLVQRELFGAWAHPYLKSAHVHAVFGGFVMFLILGVALWLFPRAEKGDTRYRPERAEAAYWLLTVGQVGGFALYFYTMWSRIRPVGSHLREAKGERF